MDLGPADRVLADHPEAERFDGRGKAVMPGFANGHTHFGLTISRGVQGDFSFPTTLKFPKGPDAYLSDGDRVVMAQLGELESIRSGTNAPFEISRNIEVYVQAMADTGLRISLGEAAYDLDQPKAVWENVFEFDDARGEAALERIELLYEKFDGAADGRVRVVPAAHAPEVVSSGMLRKIRDLAER